ncbi:glycosyltransferase family 2 protein [Enterovibrio norvegicus]|uniref:glycosyltransferase family 2 protein n=1 Tax=Enterovibrio norvegicus TaxID=188144 RepID=UPI00354B9BFF
MFDLINSMPVWLLFPVFINILILIYYVPGLFIGSRISLPEIKENQRILDVTVILPTYNDENGVKDSLESIKNQYGCHRYKVIVINDASTDRTPIIINEWIKNNDKNGHYLHINLPTNSGLKGRAINRIIDRIDENCDAVVILDGDTVLDRYAIDSCLRRLFNEPNLAAVCGMVIPINNGLKGLANRLQKGELLGAFHGIKIAQCNMGSNSNLAGALTVHKMEAIKDVGWFDDWLVEDICWTWKAKVKGWELGYVKESIAYTDCPNNMLKLWKQRRRWSRGRLEALKVALIENWRNSHSIILPFIYSTTQIFIVPCLFLSAFFNPELTAITYGTLLFLHYLFAHVNIKGLRNSEGNTSNIKIFESALWTSLFVDFFLWIPNAVGFFDEVMGKEKRWLTR